MRAAIEPDQKVKGKEQKKTTRMQVRMGRGSPLNLPETRCAYLVDWLEEVGPAVSGGMGMSPVPFQEIKAWSEMTGTELSKWEAYMLGRLSKQFVYQMNAASDPKCAEPNQIEVIDLEEARKTADEKIRKLF